MAGSTTDGEVELLTETRRRHVIRYLMRDPSDRASIDELVESVVEAAAAGHEPNREEVRIGLHHKDLPKLADRGLVEYDSRSGAVRYCPNDRVETLLECFPGG